MRSSGLSDDELLLGAGIPPARAWLVALFIAALYFLSAVPTLRWQEFSSGSEKLVVATVLEMKRGGPWWTPTLKGEPRLAKPPLTAWIAASSVSPETIRRLDTVEAGARAEAYRDLAWQIRWPTLLSSALALLAVFELGRLILGPRVGLVGMLFAATSLMYLRYGRLATTDVQLALWVGWSNVLLVHALLRERWGWALPAAGVTLALAFMSKGPVMFAQALLPSVAATWVLRPAGARLPRLTGGFLLALVAALVLFCVIGFPWYADQFRLHGLGVLKKWKAEVTREGATELPPDPFYNYVSIFVSIAPWFVFFFAGLISIVRERRTPWGKPLLAAGLFLGIPIVIMSCVKDKPERYLLPALPAAALLSAAPVVALYLRQHIKPADIFYRRVGLGVAWFAAFTIAIVGSVAPAIVTLSQLLNRFTKIDSATLMRSDGSAWHPPLLAAGVTVALVMLLSVAVVGFRQLWYLPTVGAALAMMVAGTLGYHAYTVTPSGRSAFLPVAELLRTAYPDRPVYSPLKQQDRLSHDLNIYLNSIVHEIDHAEDVAPPDSVLLVMQKERFGEPIVPKGWKAEHTLSGIEKRVLKICVRDGATNLPVTGEDSPGSATAPTTVPSASPSSR